MPMPFLNLDKLLLKLDKLLGRKAVIEPASAEASAVQVGPLSAPVSCAVQTYVQAFGDARRFSEQFAPDFPQRACHTVSPDKWMSMVWRAKEVVPDVFQEMRRQKDQFWAFGTSCADVHWYVLKKLHQNFDESFELTIGGVLTPSGSGFPYTLQDFHAHANVKPALFMGHAWITCGDRFIIDLTLGTYLVNLKKRNKRYGHVIYGEPGALKFSQFEDGLVPRTDLTYSPIAVGTAAIMAISPTRKDWASSR